MISLYKLAVWYIGKYNKKYEGPYTKDLGELKKLTYKVGEKYYLFYGLDNEWRNFGGYDVLDNAIQKLGKYENRCKNH